jgi:transposase-like protein
MSPTSANAACVASGDGGAGGKTVVFGILKRHGQVYTEIVPDVKKPRF